MAPVPHCVKVANSQRIGGFTSFYFVANHCGTYAKFPGDKLAVPYRAFVVKCDCGHYFEVMHSTKVFADEVRTHFAYCIWRDRIKRTVFVQQTASLRVAIHL